MLGEGEGVGICSGDIGGGLSCFGALGVDLEGEHIGPLIPDVDVAEGLDVDHELLHCSQLHIQINYTPSV